VVVVGVALLAMYISVWDVAFSKLAQVLLR
jgi:hypothetical protein